MNSPFPSPDWVAEFSATRADRAVRKILKLLPFLGESTHAAVYHRGERIAEGPLGQAIRLARLGARRSARRGARKGGTVRPVWVVRAPFVRIQVWAGWNPAQTWAEITPDL